MTERFVVDASHGTMGVLNWVEGPPERSVWTGVKLSGRRRSPIATWRCGRCGFLEHYAIAEPDRKQESEQTKQVLLVLGITLAIVMAVLGAVVLLR